MTLPDERPRPSVANLIGRFEQQNKSSSTSPSGPIVGASSPISRSSSVVSHITGDSAKEELKEKREWPPRSAVSTEDGQNGKAHAAPDWQSKMSTLPPSSFKAARASLFGAAATNFAGSATAIATSTGRLTIVTESIPNLQNTSEVSVVTSARSNGTPNSASMVPASSVLVAAVTPTTAPSSTTNTYQRSHKTASSLSRAFPFATPSASPARPKTSSSAHATSAMSHVQPKTPSSHMKSTLKATPTRPKTPGSLSKMPKTPASAGRPRTPSSVRPRTPATGLFAPTAASLARSRDAQSERPKPTKKIVLSSDRLSKPTAASLSRARTPVQAKPKTSPSSAAKKPAGRATPRPSALDARRAAANKTPTHRTVAAHLARNNAPRNGGVPSSAGKVVPVTSKSLPSQESNAVHEVPSDISNTVEPEVHAESGEIGHDQAEDHEEVREQREDVLDIHEDVLDVPEDVHDVHEDAQDTHEDLHEVYEGTEEALDDVEEAAPDEHESNPASSSPLAPAFTVDESEREVAPTEAAPPEVVSAEVAPTEVAPTEVTVAPADVAPTEVAPTEVAPAEVAPAEVVPAEVAPTEGDVSDAEEAAPVTPLQSSGDDIEDIVNLLESGMPPPLVLSADAGSTPHSRPLSMASIPDEE